MEDKRQTCRRNADLCLLHEEKDCQIDMIREKVEEIAATQHQIESKFIKSGLFTWIVSGISAIVLIIMSLAYISLKDVINTSIAHWHEKDEQQDFEIREMRKKFDLIDAKLDRNLDQIQELHGLPTMRKR